MTIATNALDWLARYPQVAAPERTRGAITEGLEPGDVFDDGSILTADGNVMAEGAIWLCARKAAAAEYYGWFPDGSYGIGWDMAAAHRLYVVRR